jgi:hypothetical protein
MIGCPNLRGRKFAYMRSQPPRLASEAAVSKAVLFGFGGISFALISLGGVTINVHVGEGRPEARAMTTSPTPSAPLPAPPPAPRDRKPYCEEIETPGCSSVYRNLNGPDGRRAEGRSSGRTYAEACGKPAGTPPSECRPSEDRPYYVDSCGRILPGGTPGCSVQPGWNGKIHPNDAYRRW